MDRNTFLRRNGRRLAKLILLFFIVLGVVGIFTYTSSLQLPVTIVPDTIKILVVGKTNQDLAFWLSLRDGLGVAAQEYGVEYEYWAPDDESEIDKQIALVYQAIEENPDAIILVSSDYVRLAGPARAIINADIKLIIMDSDVDRSGQSVESCFVATDNVAAGIKAGEAMQALLPEGKKVAVISHRVGATTSTDRDAGVRLGLSPDTQVMTTLDAAGSEEKAYELAKEVLKDPDVGGIVCLNEYSTTGAARALIGAGQSGEMPLVGFDSSPSLNTYLEEGCLNATVIQRPFNMGYVAMVNAVTVVKGGSVDPFYDTGSILVTKETMYLEENEKLLFPFT